MSLMTKNQESGPGVQLSGRACQETGGSRFPSQHPGVRGAGGGKEETISVYSLKDRNQFQVPDHRNIPRMPGAQNP